jgi:hypothetical protein
MAGLFHSGKIVGMDSQGSVAAGPLAIGRLVAPAAASAMKSARGSFLPQLIANWAAIAGIELAGYTRPIKLSKMSCEAGKQGIEASSTLHLQVGPARALDVQYAVPQIIERINGAFGFKAVAAIRIVQGPMPGKDTVRPAAKPLPARPAAPEKRLSAALGRMSAAVAARTPER